MIEDGARIGSDTMLIAPVRVGRDANTGAGSVITKDVPPGALAVERAEQGTWPATGTGRTRSTAGGGAERGDHDEEADDALLGHHPPDARARDRGEPRDPGQRGRDPALRLGRDLLPRRGVGARRRRVHRADPLRARERGDHGAADHDRRDEAGEREAHHRRRAVLRLLAAGQEGRLAGSDQREARRRPALRRRREPRGVGRPAQRPDPGVLRRAVRPPDRACR